MNTAVENIEQFSDNKDEIKAEGQSTLGQLGSAIRRSTVLFVIATIFLIVAFFLVLNRQNAFSAIVAQIERINSFQIDVLNMRGAEKDFRLNNAPTYILEYNASYEDASNLIDEMLSSPAVNDADIVKINQLNVNVSTYKDIFDSVVAIYDTLGMDDSSGLNQQLRNVAMDFNAELNQITENSNVEAALLKARGISKDFVIFGREQFIAPYNQAIDNFRQVVIDEEGLDVEVKQRLLGYADTYQNAFNAFAEKTLQANRIISDTTIAAHASLYPLPAFTDALKVRQKEIAQQLIYILIAVAVILVGIFLLVIYQLRRAQQSANETLEETIAAQQAAEEENDRLNDSVINILEAVNALSQRDLTARAPVTEDVIGTVSDSINALADETSRVLQGVTGIAGRVSQVSDNVRGQAAQVSLTAQEERDSVAQMIESLFEATQTMNQMAALAEQSNESAGQATEVTDGALKTVTDTVDGMELIRETISETEKRIKRLGERSQEISGIVNLINTISERTHVLALNASMQAAVAGEAGRGFAVVAQEVQQLAESSRQATDQIAALVNNIQIETNETINTVNRTIGQVVEGSDQAQRAGEQMRRTQQITNELVSRVQSIAQASQKQKEMSAQLLEAVQRIGDSTEKTAAQIAEQNAGTEELQKAATDLVNSVNVFKLPAAQS